MSTVNPLNGRSSATSTIATRRVAARVASALAAIGIGVATAFPAAADPQVLSVAGSWNMVQTNGYTVNLTLRQDGGNVSGVANTRGLSSNNVTGTVSTHSIDLTIPWTPGNSVGIYHGELTQNRFALPGAYFTGNTFDQTHPQSRADWFSDGLNLPWG